VRAYVFTARRVGSSDWSILSVLPTAVKLTREGEEDVREFATGSTTSSNVIVATQNQASDALPATFK